MTEPTETTTHADPAPADAAVLVRDAVDADRAAALVGSCTVDYDGRASGHVDPGVRHVVRQPDGTLLVHGATGHRPLAWHAGDGDFTTTATADDRLVLRAESNTEELTVALDAVHALTVYDPDDADKDVQGTEADVVSRLLNDPDLVESGFTPLATERDTPAGPVDIYGRDANGRICVVEVKRSRVGPDAATQLDRYVRALREDLHTDSDIRGILVAPSVTQKCRDILLERGHDFSPFEA
ncbi:endonuclease NucS [Halocalculus aciditolerans]|uniref:Endonuclease NucS n=1 Tax=Halocalculus aciditolerans TaxID=1383812 RepID=A0A830FMJ1_9EURY|nr:endonuclease NucS [Halocalculus aciditolerans]GGL70446.1 endonuclease NucS [Halocalculus aciditolerans]